jgi:hypothetical protein
MGDADNLLLLLLYEGGLSLTCAKGIPKKKSWSYLELYIPEYVPFLTVTVGTLAAAALSATGMAAAVLSSEQAVTNLEDTILAVTTQARTRKVHRTSRR